MFEKMDLFLKICQFQSIFEEIFTQNLVDIFTFLQLQFLL